MGAKPLNVLCLDDDADDAKLLERLLGLVCPDPPVFHHAADFRAGERLLIEQSIDVIFLDRRLGDQAGLEVLEQLRAAGEDRPIFLLTRKGNEQTAIGAMKAGADDYLVKSDLSPELLRRAIEHGAAQHQRRVRAGENHQRLMRELQQSNELLHRKNQRLAEMYETAHQFVDNVSHEFRTPLTVIKEFTSIIHDGLAGPTTDQQREYLNTVLDRADDLATMIDDMLDSSKIEAGLLGVWRRESSLSDILHRTRTTLQRKAAAAGVRLVIDRAEHAPSVYCDPEKIGRVIINLAVNAIKFSKVGGDVRILAVHEERGAQLRIAVADAGPGIPPETLGAIFDRFRQAGGRVATTPKGFGLGLSIAKELVELNLGDMEIDSEVGRGSTFSFSLPTFIPERLIERYLSRVEHLRNGSPSVSLILARSDDRTTRELYDESERFLVHQIRRNDLIFSTGPGSWLIVAACGQRESGNMLRRIDRSLREANANRPRAPLSALHLHIDGSWNVNEDRETIMARFEQAMAPAELVAR